MPVDDYQDTAYPNAGDEHNNVSCIPPYPVSWSSHSLEDGEIVEGHISNSIAFSELPSPQPSDQPESHFSDQAGTSMPVEPVGSLAPTPVVEPMTDEDLDRAKSLVLDLLGWGVTPEYFVECGLSPGAIYKIFTDLRLRLPRNLELSSSLTTRPTVQ